jgi:8-oxo-dGTP diphosphatase
MGMSDYIRDIRAKIGADLLLLPGVAAVIIDPDGRVLLQRRSDSGEWGLPGGAIEPGEEPAEALVREILEETALDVVPERVVGVVSITFACRPVAGEPRVNDDESLEVRYFAPHALPAMPPRHRRRIEDALRGDPRARFTAP